MEDTLIEFGKAAGALLAIIALGAAFSRARAVKWLWRRIISEPLAEWQRVNVEHVTEPLRVEVVAVRDAVGVVDGKFVALDDRVSGHMDSEERREARYELWAAADLEERDARQVDTDIWKASVDTRFQETTLWLRELAAAIDRQHSETSIRTVDVAAALVKVTDHTADALASEKHVDADALAAKVLTTAADLADESPSP